MSSRVTYDSNDEIKLLVGYARRCKAALELCDVDSSELDEFEYDFVMGQFKKGTNPVSVALTIARWRDQSAAAAANFPTEN